MSLADRKPWVDEPAIDHREDCHGPDVVMMPADTLAVFCCLACGGHAIHRREHVAARKYRKDGRRLVATLPVVGRMFRRQ